MSDNRGRPTKEVEATKNILITNIHETSEMVDDGEFTARQLAEIEYAVVALLSHLSVSKRRTDASYVEEFVEDITAGKYRR